MKRIILLLYLLLGLTLSGMAQQRITGKVISASDKTPLPGATVRVKGTGNAVVTDKDGHFTLPAIRHQDVLAVTFLGYITHEVELTIPLGQELVIMLAENPQQLKEVVVSTGYQQLPQERATGSFAQVDKQRLQEQVSTDVISRLEAVANGLAVDRATSPGGRVMVRGLSTIQGPRDPLIVVDNFPYEGDLNNINPNDVESITILKDAAAASIWGTRAGNGVIVITTKKGRMNQPFTVEFNTNVTLTEKPDLFNIRQIASSDFIDLEQMLFREGYYDNYQFDESRPALTPVVELLIAKANGTLSEAEADARINALRQVDVRDEFARHMYRQSVNQQYSLGFKGGTSNHAWLLSAGYDQNLSHLDAGYKRLNLRFQNTLKPLKNLELSTGIYYTQSQATSGKPAYGEVSFMYGSLYPYAAFADAAGNPLPIIKEYSQSYLDTAGGGRLLDWKYYPLEDYRHRRNTTHLQDMTGNAGLLYRLPFGLEAEVKYQYQRQQTNGRLLQDAQSFAARDLVNTFTFIDPETGAITYRVPKGGILDQSTGLVEAQHLRGQLNFNRSWDDHEVAAIAGSEIRSTAISGSSHRLYGYQDDILAHGNVDYTTPYPTFIAGWDAFIPNPASLTGRVNRFVSLFSNAAYTYRQRYTLSVSARRDASNLFGVQANDRWNPLWSSGLAWNVSREPWFENELLPYLKLRTTYGFSGNVDQGRTAVTTINYQSTSPYTLGPRAVFGNYANPNLKWETAGMLNLGADFRLKGDRLAGSLEFYRKNGSNLFGRELLDYTSGVGASIIRNVAQMEGKGMDLELNSLNLQSSAFRWTSHFNLSLYRDKVTRYYLSSMRGSSFVSQTPTVSGEEGRPVYAIYSYKWAGLDPQTGDPQGYVEGQVSKDYTRLTGPNTLISDLEYHGSALPTVFGSLGNTFSFGKLSVTARATYKLGYYFRRESVVYSGLFANSNGHSDFGQRWQKPGDEATTHVPSLAYPANGNRDAFYAGSSALVERGDHLRLQYITASYDFSRERWKRLPFTTLQAYLNVNNLGLLWKANNHGLDPDHHQGAAAIPPARSYALGLRASF